MPVSVFRNAHTPEPADTTITSVTSSLSGTAPYSALHTYLKGRHADRVVLTFAQMEDLSGFPLPDEASVNPAWWSNDAAGAATPQARVWVQAGRRATPNLKARTVLFERVSS